MTKRMMLHIVPVVVLIGSLLSARAQELSIPDPGLDAAIRSALQKPSGALSEQDLLSLTNLDAGRRNVRSISGLEAARNLVSLDLKINGLTNFSLPSELARLSALDLSDNALTNISIPEGMTNLAVLTVEGNDLTNLRLPADLVGLKTLDLSFNQFTNVFLPSGLTSLETLTLRGDLLTDFAFPQDVTRLTELDLSENQFTSFSLPAGMTNLLTLNLFFNQLTNLSLSPEAHALTDLYLDFNRLSRIELPTNLTNLEELRLRANLFTNFTLPAGLTSLTSLDLSTNPLTSITLPAGLGHLRLLRLTEDRLTSLTLPLGLTNLQFLGLSANSLTNLLLPPDLFHLETLLLGGNQLASLDLPAGLTNLTGLYLPGNLLTSLTLPPDMTGLTNLSFLANPLTTLVVSELLAASTNLIVNLNDTIATLPAAGVSVFTYPLTIQLWRPRPVTGAFQFGITGPPGVYAILASSDLQDWHQVGIASNTLGSVSFVDTTSHLFLQRYYRAMPQTPLPDMVFIPPNTFTMGSSASDLDHNVNETPQTTVVLTRGFWIGKYEVTQGEYLSVMNTNPSDFPGDLSRPVSSVTWFDATNYCARLTEQELAAGRIAPGTRFRLPTEAEWECAARAGTSTRFSYGDDPGYASATNYMWYASNAGLTVHPVGQKLSNPWGLYDMSGNVWEWCQDWYDVLPGGVQTDPTGPAGPVQFDEKVMRGGAYDYPDSSCRSASRLFRYESWPDSDVGFRVVLVSGP